MFFLSTAPPFLVCHDSLVERGAGAQDHEAISQNAGALDGVSKNGLSRGADGQGRSKKAT